MAVQIYRYKCDAGHRFERPFLTEYGLICLEPGCGELCTVIVTEAFSYGLTLMNGQYPSFRRRYLGTAPYTTRDTSGERVKGGPGAKGQRANMQAQKWLRSIE